MRRAARVERVQRDAVLVERVEQGPGAWEAGEGGEVWANLGAEVSVGLHRGNRATREWTEGEGKDEVMEERKTHRIRKPDTQHPIRRLLPASQPYAPLLDRPTLEREPFVPCAVAREAGRA